MLAAARDGRGQPRRCEAVIVAWADAAAGLRARRRRDDHRLLRLGAARVGRSRRAASPTALDDARDAVVAERQRARGPARRLRRGHRAWSAATRAARRAPHRPDARARSCPTSCSTLSVLGGMYAAVDLTAGEKERGTMQTLLVRADPPGGDRRRQVPRRVAAVDAVARRQPRQPVAHACRGCCRRTCPASAPPTCCWRSSSWCRSR